MNLLEINVFILWFQSEFWNDFVAMKLPFSRINEERKFKFIFLSISLFKRLSDISGCTPGLVPPTSSSSILPENEIKH